MSMTRRQARPNQRQLKIEVIIVLALSLGQSAVYSIVSFLDKVTRAPLRDQTTSLNNPLSDRAIFDLTYQLLDIVFALVPVALALYFISQTHPGKALRLLGMDRRRMWRDIGIGMGLFAVIGIGTLGVYALGRAFGVTTAIAPANLGEHWWTVPVLLLSAARHAVLEEVLMIGFLYLRGRMLGLAPLAIVLASALLRASYHLYQGVGPFAGNLLMGLIFGAVYLRYRRVLPLVIAHFVIDAVGFVGFALIGPAIGVGA